MTLTRLLLALLLTLATIGPSTTSAQDGAELETEARAHFSLGQIYYGQGRFAQAATEFEAAYALHPHPLLLHNLYLSRRDMGDIVAATDALTRYLAAATDLSASDRRLLDARLAAMHQQIAAMPPTHETNTPVVTPPSDPVVGDEPDAHDTVVDPADALPPPTPAHDDSLVTGAIVSFSIAGVALVTAAITGGVALSQRGDLANSCAPSCSDDQVSVTRTLGVVTDVMFGISAAAAATAIVLTVIGLQSNGDVQVRPSVSADHAALFVGGTF